MKPEQGEAALAILQTRDDIRTDVVLEGGRKIAVWNIAWGRDIGEDFHHVTTNISPDAPHEHAIDVFLTNEIVAILDPQSGDVLFRRDAA